MNREKIAARLLVLARELLAANLKREAIKYAEEVLDNLQRKLGSQFDDLIANDPKKIQYSVVTVLAALGRKGRNVNYGKYKPFMPRSFDSEFPDWWYDLTDAKQFTVVREAMVRKYGVDRGSLTK